MGAAPVKLHPLQKHLGAVEEVRMGVHVKGLAATRAATDAINLWKKGTNRDSPARAPASSAGSDTLRSRTGSGLRGPAATRAGANGFQQA